MPDQKINTKKQENNNQTNTKETLKQELKEVKREVIKEIEQEKIIGKKTAKLKQNQKTELQNQEEEIVQAKNEVIAKAKTNIPARTAIIYVQSSKNNTHITLADITGSEILAKASGGMLIKNKAHRDEQAAAIGLVQLVETVLAAHKISRLLVKVRGKGGIKSDRIGQAAQIILKMLSRDKYEIIYIEDVTPIYYGKKTKYGRRGRKV